MRRNSPLAIFAVVFLSGCGSPQPELVYVDVNRVLAGERAPEMDLDPLPEPPAAARAVSVKQAGLPATSVTDRTLQRLELAKKLIAANRGKSIESLSLMLKRIYLARAEDEIQKRNLERQPEQDSILAGVLARIRAIFEKYGEERGPLLAQVNILARTSSLADQVIPENADAITKYNLTEANKIRAQIREIDRRYDAEADALLAESEKEIAAEIVRLEQLARTERATAEAKAVKEAESKATQTQTSLNVQIKQLVPEKLPAVPGRQVVVPGSAPLPPPPTDTNQPIFGSLEERRHLLNQEIDIWIKTSGRKRSLSANGGRDATEEFLQWRSAHKVGP